MKRFLLCFAMLVVCYSLMFSQNYVLEWEGPVNYEYAGWRYCFLSPSLSDLNNDGHPDIVLYSDQNNTFTVNNPVNNYDLIWEHEFNEEYVLIGFANVTDNSLNEMIVRNPYDESNILYVINTLTYEVFTICDDYYSEVGVMMYDIDFDGKDEILFQEELGGNFMIWGDGSQSSIDTNSVHQTLIKLNQNYPNPFNPSTTINYELKYSGFVNLKVYNVKGQLVDTLVNREINVGKHSAVWNAKGFSSGQYFYQISIDGKAIQTKKAICLK